MVTAFRSSAPRRPRAGSAGLWRILWLAAVLLGVLYTHGASGEIVAEHVTPTLSTTSPTSPAATAPTPAHADEPTGHGDHSAHHSAQDCASGQPQQSTSLSAPDACPLDPVGLSLAHAAVNSRSAHADTAAPPRQDSAVLLI